MTGFANAGYNGALGRGKAQSVGKMGTRTGRERAWSRNAGKCRVRVRIKFVWYRIGC